MGERRLVTLIKGLSPASAWWTFHRNRKATTPPLEGAAAQAYFDRIAG